MAASHRARPPRPRRDACAANQRHVLSGDNDTEIDRLGRVAPPMDMIALKRGHTAATGTGFGRASARTGVAVAAHESIAARHERRGISSPQFLHSASIKPLPSRSGHRRRSSCARGTHRLIRARIDFKSVSGIGLAVIAGDAARMLLEPSVQFRLTAQSARTRLAIVLHRNEVASAKATCRTCPRISTNVWTRLKRLIEPPAAFFLDPWARALAPRCDEALAIGVEPPLAQTRFTARLLDISRAGQGSLELGNTAAMASR